MDMTTTIPEPTANVVSPRKRQVFQVDLAHSEATFRVRHLVTRVRGQFDDFSARIELDVDEPTRSSVEMVIKTASVQTFNEERDQHLRSTDFFDAETYPEIRFVSDSIEHVKDDLYNVHGDLTIRGVTRTVELPVHYMGTTKDPWGNFKAGFETEITIDRTDFGMRFNAPLDTGGFLLGDDVSIAVNIEANLVEPEAEAAAS